MLDRVADAFRNEDERWIIRDASWLPKDRGGGGWQVARYDDSDLAGSFSEIHTFNSQVKAEEALNKLSRRAAASAALNAALTIQQKDSIA